MHIDKLTKRFILIILFSVPTLVIYGHATNNPLLTSFGDEKVTMKFVTAFLFFVTTLNLVYKRPELVWLILITATYTFTSWFINQAKPLFLPIFESGPVTRSLKGDIPSWATLVSFIMIAVGFLTPKNKTIPRVLAVISVLAFIGHITRMRFMYWYIPGISTGMAINTAILFFHIACYRLIELKEK